MTAISRVRAALAARERPSDDDVRAELLAAAICVRDDMILRADIGTWDGDHDIQMGDGTWQRFIAAIDAAIREPK